MTNPLYDGEIPEADIVVGIPCHNAEATVRHVMAQAAWGIVEHFPMKKGLLVVSAGDSEDESLAVARGAVLPTGVPLVAGRYQGPPGKGSAVRAVFEIGLRAGAECVLLLDADLISVSPLWVRNLAGPLYEGFGYTTPFYKRFKFDGTITNSLAHPLVSALYGVAVRQPIGGDFGLSRALVETVMDEDWPPEAYRFGIDIFLTTTALTGGFSLAQAALGAKVHDLKDPAADLSGMFKEVVGSAFSMVLRHRADWARRPNTAEPPVLGSEPEVMPVPFRVNAEALEASFARGQEKFQAIWERVLPGDVLEQLGRRELTDQHWARAVFAFLRAYADSGDKDLLLSSMIPLYNLQTLSMVRRGMDMTDEEFEQRVVGGIRQAFLEQKSFLFSLWQR